MPGKRILISPSGIRNNYGAVRDPLVTDDITEGYSSGSSWYNKNTNSLFECVDNSVGSAVWVATSLLNDVIIQGTFDSGDLSGGVLTVVHNLSDNLVVVNIFDDSNIDIGGIDYSPTDSNTIAIDLSMFTVTGTWKYKIRK